MCDSNDCGCQSIWDSSELVVNWFEIQVIWLSIASGFKWFGCELIWDSIQMIWRSNGLRFNCFGCQMIWDSNDLVVNWFGIQAGRRFPFLRDFLQKWSFEAQKPSFPARLPSKMNETLKLKNEAFVRDILQKWKFEYQKRSFSASAFFSTTIRLIYVDSCHVLVLKRSSDRRFHVAQLHNEEILL